MKTYKDLDVYNEAFRLAVDVHKMSMALPKIEMYELGSQIRRSAQSVRANIVEGYGRRKYKADFLRFLITANASLLETESHLEMLNELYDKDEFRRLIRNSSDLGKKMHRFIEFVQKSWKTNS